jgi:hypothetical protein
VFAVSSERGGGIKGIGVTHIVINQYMFYDNLRARHDLRPLWAQEISEKAWSSWYSRDNNDDHLDSEKPEPLEQPGSVCVCVTLCETLTRLYAELRLRVARMRRRRYKYMELKKFQ